MILEVTGTSTRNKGAELMMAAIVGRFAKWPEVSFAVPPQFGSYPERAKYGLWQKVRLDHWGRSRLGFGLLPDRFRKNSGMVTEAQIDGVIDASGFAFSDQLPVGTAVRFAASCQRWKSQGKRIVLLPQALGPFMKERARTAFRTIAECASLIYARDADSHRFAVECVPGLSDRIRIAPDITVGLEGRAVSLGDGSGRSVLVVPNVRMTDRTADGEARAYVPFLGRCIRCCAEQGLGVRILIHDAGEDEALLDPLQRELGTLPQVIRELDPVRLKGIISDSSLVIGSRFHALVSALSSGVPALAAGWSHKYERLFESFGCAGNVLSVHSPAADLDAVIRKLTGSKGVQIRADLERAASGMRRELDRMWMCVDEVFGVKDGGARG